ncbi:MAG: [protein-PII] uridylyltransferase [Gammaproteobacteria bacterium]|nr:[protein-PII] uridylyltransferase [Gammaproteobacteria bacterium]
MPVIDRPQDQATLISSFRDALTLANKHLHQHFDQGDAIENLVHCRSFFIDEILRRIWAYWLQNDANNLALLAVGGYGRSELLPGSDIDLMILLPSEENIPNAAMASFLQFLWDIGLEVGHSVRTLQDCIEQSRQDITIATNIMESRLIYGDQTLYKELKQIATSDDIWTSRDFFEAKSKEQQLRHAKYHDTAYNLEPNIKEGPGGLRDIQMIGWVAKRHFGAETLKELISHDFLTEDEYHALWQGQCFLWQVRYALHQQTGRREDRLLFDYQRNLAEKLGYSGEGNKAIEGLMKQYYCTVMELERLNDMLLQHFQEAILYTGNQCPAHILNRRFHVIHGFLEVSDDQVFARYPFALLEIFLLMAQHPEIKGVRASTIRLIRAHLHLINDDFRQDLRSRSLFMEIIRQPLGVTHELRRMNRYGVLAAYLPEFNHIVGQMQYDLFHAYTVDEHTLFVVRNIRRLTIDEFSEELPYCSDIIKRIPKLELLIIAGIFHDIAKGRGGNHSELGAIEVTRFCQQHSLSSYDTNLIAWLVQSHLLMSTTAQRRDISDPDVIREFAALVENPQRLNYLYLLTVADIRATNAKLWTSWKGSLLQELHIATTRALRIGLDNPVDHQQHIDAIKTDARSLLSERQVTDQAIDEQWQWLNDEYFVRNTAEQICWQTMTLIKHKGSNEPLVDFRHDSERGGTEIFIYTKNRDGLFTITAHQLDQLCLTIADARTVTLKNGYAMEIFVVLESSGEDIRDQHRLEQIQASVKQRLLDINNSFSEISRNNPRQFKHFRISTRIDIINKAAEKYTIVEIITGDHPGLLSQIGQVFIQSDIRLHNAKIATFGSKAEDVFYITDHGNRPINDQDRLDKLHQQLIQSLESEQEQAKQ